MFVKGDEIKKKHKELNNRIWYHGIVVDNEDPMKLGRIKCQVNARWEEAPIERLPWIFPMNPYGLGGSKMTSYFGVPELMTEVWVMFPFDDEYYPFYIGYPQSEKTHQDDWADEDYPETFGFCDSQVHWWRVNKKERYTEWFHISGMTLRHYDEGEIHWHIPKNLHITVGEDMLVKVMGKQVWEVDSTCSKIVKGKQVLTVLSDRSERITGNRKLDVYGDSNRLTVGNEKELTIANKKTTVGGNKITA